jgi:hypothetical protein
MESIMINQFYLVYFYRSSIYLIEKIFDLDLKVLGIIVAVCSISGCGTYVPGIGQAFDDRYTESGQNIELLIKEKIYCELQKAVHDVNQGNPIYVESNSGKIQTKKPLPETWGAQMTLNLIVDENTTITPSTTYINPINAVESFSAGFGGSVSTDANRTDKFTFYYLISDLDGHQTNCDSVQDPNTMADVKPADLHGNSLLLQSDLGIYNWLNNAMRLRTGVGVSRSSQQETYVYDVKFDVQFTGNANPAWKLVHITTGGGGNLFSAKHDGTHELILTFGPSQTAPGKKPEPGNLAAGAANAQEIGSAVANALKASFPSGLPVVLQ